MTSISLTTALTSQGLYRGVEEGTKIDYTWTYNDMRYGRDIFMNEDIFVNITRVQPVEYLRGWYTTIGGPSGVSIDLFWANGTPLQRSTYLISYDALHPLPVGNWTLITELYKNYWPPGSANVTQSETVWSYNETITSSTWHFMRYGEFTKVDGVVRILIEEDTSIASGETLFYSKLVSSDYTTSTSPESLNVELTLTIIGGISVIVVVVIVIIRRKP